MKDVVAHVPLPLTHAAAICSDTLLIVSLKAGRGAAMNLINLIRRIHCPLFKFIF